MALTPLSGSSNTPSIPNSLPSNIPNTQLNTTAHMPFITNSAFNKYAIDASQYPDVVRELLGFMKGKRIQVTYYRLLNNNASSNRSNVADFPTLRNAIDTEFQKILNLELTLPKDFDFSPSTSQGNMTITGSVMFYPGMNPSIGDIFLYGMGDGRVGVCRISSITIGSWRDSRMYTATFLVQEFLDEVTQAALEAMVSQVVVFDKENFLGGTACLLSEQTYVQLQQISTLRSNLCKYYQQTFFDADLCSYVHPNTTYDPWVVQFMVNKISMDDIFIRPKNLFGIQARLYRKTLWARLEDRYNNSVYGLSAYYTLRGYNETSMGVFVTELYGHQIVHPESDASEGDLYLYSAAFYNGDTVHMTAEELLVYNAITKRSAGDLTTLLTTYLNTVFTLDMDDQFYKIPLYIHLIDMSLQNQFREIDAPSMNAGSSPLMS